MGGPANGKATSRVMAMATRGLHPENDPDDDELTPLTDTCDSAPTVVAASPILAAGIRASSGSAAMDSAEDTRPQDIATRVAVIEAALARFGDMLGALTRRLDGLEARSASSVPTMGPPANPSERASSAPGRWARAWHRNRHVYAAVLVTLLLTAFAVALVSHFAP